MKKIITLVIFSTLKNLWRHDFMTSHRAYYRCVLSFWMPVAQVFFDFSAVFLEILQGLFSTKKPTSTKHLLCHHLYIIERVLLKSMLLPIYSFKGLLTPNSILKDVILVKTMFKSVFLFNTVHARTRVWAIRPTVFAYWPPPPPPKICVHAFHTTWV